MAYIPYRNDLNTIKHAVPDKIVFSILTPDELKKMAVVKINRSLTVDPLGHPLLGGLYDPRMGPLTEKSDPCATCNRKLLQCPGHFGYIQLPLPVVNPIFHKIVGLTIRISCLSCYHIQIPRHIKHSIAIQLKLLSCGLICEALEVENMIMGLVAEHGSLEQIPDTAKLPIKEYEDQASASLAANGEIFFNKNIEKLWNECVTNLFSQVKPRQACMFCKVKMNRIQALKNKVLMTTRRTDMSESVDRFNISGRGVVSHESRYITPDESREFLRQIWIEEREIMQHVAPVLRTINVEYPTHCFYMDLIPVLPPNTRPVNFIDGRMSEHPLTRSYKEILNNALLLHTVIRVMKPDGNVDHLQEDIKAIYNIAPGDSPVEKLNNAWQDLQMNVDSLLDKDNARGGADIFKGFKQVIEKKAGIIRMNMMGKRVNFAARSVIAPDPNLNVDEIGIPEVIAKKLTYPASVTPWNVEQLRKMIENGPNVHPGAVQVEFENGNIRQVSATDELQRTSLLKSLLTPDGSNQQFKGVKKVHRHLQNGDVVLVNRQPTLHRPSIMAHKTRILKDEQTLRLHYSNCKAYNADFDGDEMNIHFPQNELGRSEAYNLVNVSNNYLVPKDGTPLGGLIQDHVIAGVKLTLRGKFFNKLDYTQLVYQALSFKTSRIKTLPPAIIKPHMLWSGKQVISTVLINIIPEEKAKINLKGSAKISDKAWIAEEPRPWQAGGTPFTHMNAMSEAEVIIQNGELLVGVLDKTHYGATAYGLVHCMYELYGGNCATRLLSSLARMFTYFLQVYGFTLGVRDILVVQEAEKKRKRLLKKALKTGTEVMTSVLNLPPATPMDEIVEKLESEAATNKNFRTKVDRGYKASVDKYTNLINKACLPAGLWSKFPENNLQLMVQSGAKGSMVNTMQISCLLGQIELEGKRPPVMISGKSLPSFPTFELSPRAGGFIGGRFMTGIQPQEFFFHCMAGREGLIDTAVKTSRSGYLQRCLIKHLEGITVQYDMTVRDSDRTVIQFLYGEDGMDVSKTQFLNPKQASFLKDNADAIIDTSIIRQLKDVNEKQLRLKEHAHLLEEWKESFGSPLQKEKPNPFTGFANDLLQRYGKGKEDAVNLWWKASPEIIKNYKEQCRPCPDPLNSCFQPDMDFGALSDKLKDLADNCDGVASKKERKKFKNIIKFKSIQSMCAAGEPVGLLAAQSVGEPSTQMTLNTFHFAGRGEMNVTLGIPRLREILMMASKNISTPSMQIPFLNIPDVEERAAKLRKKLTKVVTSAILEKIVVSYKLEFSPERQMKYKLRFCFLPPECYSDKFSLKQEHIIKHMKEKFFNDMSAAIKKHSRFAKNLVMIEMESNKSKRKSKKGSSEEEGDAGEENEDNPSANDKNAEENEDQDSLDEEPEDSEDAKLGGAKYDQEPEEEEAEKEEAEEGEAEVSEDEDNAEANGQSKEDDEDIAGVYHLSKDITYNKKKSWCEFKFGLPLDFKRMLLTQILKQVAEKCVITETPHIKNAIIIEENGSLMLKTEGINIPEMFKYHDLLDLNRIYCNDIHKIAETYGIEAAVKAIVKEVKDVFGVYGIPVDPRHLVLIADYMTTSGTYLPLNRKGMECSASPLQQMSFESALTSLKTAAVRGKRDTLENPSSCLMLGKLGKSGTGILETLLDIRNTGQDH